MSLTGLFRQYIDFYFRKYVVLGDFSIGTDPDCASQTNCLAGFQLMSIKNNDDVMVHPEYKKSGGNILNDIALIRLPELAMFNGR